MHIPTSKNMDVPRRTTWTVLILCWLTIFAEGYDLGVMGTITPTLLKDQAWKLTPLDIGGMSSAALLGTLVGAYVFGILSDLRGRKPIMIACVLLFSVTMLGAAWAPTPREFYLFRFVGGLGLGGVISAAATLTVEYSSSKSRNFNFALMYSGYSLGALVSAAVGMGFIESHGWRPIVAVGFLPIIVVPAIVIWLPESLEFLVSKGRITQAKTLAKRLGINVESLLKPKLDAENTSVGKVVQAIFGRKMILTTVFVWLAEFMVILVIYGLGTWLPQIMRKSGYDMGSSLFFFIIFSLASAIGGVLLGTASDRFGAKKVVGVGFLLGALAIGGLAFKGSLLLNYVLVSIAGVGTVSAGLIYLGFIPTLYPTHARTTATGWAVGFGRLGAMSGPIVGGVVANMDIGTVWTFFIFACAALIASLSVLLIPKVTAAAGDNAEGINQASIGEAARS
ncbi:MFS transporter [Cupriavidus pinatubonensis]|uniref:4-hydroxybenzoate transporter PcaK n=1 Tax=Cupriavidus pinatubonensis TaxID=248026 RepID=A0ABM8Y4A2_9BURK|nr:MFS transporter [Cupriavidus pinatubonensis]CAG9187616.1 4-hydroxybenzoate transporter PcaK [Cupriavidus pinatubonensis]